MMQKMIIPSLSCSVCPEPGDHVEVLAPECFLLRGCLDLDEQVELCDYIASIDKTPPEIEGMPKPINQTPKSLVLAEDGKHRNRGYSSEDETVINKIVSGVCDLLQRRKLHVFKFRDAITVKKMAAKKTFLLSRSGSKGKRKGAVDSSAGLGKGPEKETEDAEGGLQENQKEPDSIQEPGSITERKVDICEHKSITMATIRYEALKHKLDAHVDHCDESLVVLISLGRTINFMIRAGRQSELKRFKFLSGDILIFNASTAAELVHGLESVDEAASEVGELLARRFPVLQNHRYGVQCRIHF
jgi:hypothetical protein